MIHLKSRKLLFLKTAKTAGTSVEIAFSCNATDEDIVTPFGDFTDELKRDEYGGHFPVNYAENKSDEELCRRKFRALKAFYKTNPIPETGVKIFDCPRRFVNHSGAAVAARELGESVFEENHTVAVVRHPYDRLVSGAFFRDRSGGDDASLREIIATLLAKQKCHGYKHLFYKDELIIDTIIRFETLADDLKALESRFDLQLADKLPRTKHKYRTDRRPAAEFLTEAERDRCYEQNKILFDMFDYKR